MANAVRDHGLTGLALATLTCGAMQMATGALKLGGVVKLTPVPVMTGFMAGIGTRCPYVLTVLFCNEFLHLSPGALIMGSQLPRALGIQSLSMDTLWLNMQNLFSAGSMELLTNEQMANLVSFSSLGTPYQQCFVV